MEIDHAFNFPLTFKGHVVKCTLVPYERVYEVLIDDELVTEIHHDTNGWVNENPGTLPDDVLKIIGEKIEKNWV
ncbi:hypothetical protein [Mucilaginibacter lappiensis]|jgi:hypothetical protein|uniref:hypothetical protein n=1 Tax=Mucilaginibacter lappiensis TaxID=354630 RepID=UPI003D1FE630